MDNSKLAELDGVRLDGFEFCARVYALFHDLRYGDPGPEVVRSRTYVGDRDLVSDLVTELIPLSAYVRHKYHPACVISVQWHSRRYYDADAWGHGLFNDGGREVELRKFCIEVTVACHPNDHLQRKGLNTLGVVHEPDGMSMVNGVIKSEPVGYSNRSYITQFAGFVRERIEAKARKAYPGGTVLIIRCDLPTIFLNDEWDEMLALVNAGMPPNSFKEIFIYEPSMDRVCSWVLEDYSTRDSAAR